MIKNVFGRHLAGIAAGFALAGSLVVMAPANAGTLSPEATQALATARSELRADRELLLTANLALTSEQSDKFWPLYREYVGKRTGLGDERIAIILAFAEAYPAVNDATAKDLVARSLKLEQNTAKLHADYAKKFAKVLPAQTLMRFLQIERRIDLLIDLQLTSIVPIVDAAGK